MRPRLEQLESRKMLASDWQNSPNPFDVDNSGTVQPLDVYLAVNDFTANGTRTLGTRTPGSTEPKCDVNGDNQITRQDVEALVAGINKYTSGALTIGVQLNDVSDPNGSEVVLQPNVTYEGTTMPYTKVRVEAVGLDDYTGDSASRFRCRGKVPVSNPLCDAHQSSSLHG